MNAADAKANALGGAAVIADADLETSPWSLCEAEAVLESCDTLVLRGQREMARMAATLRLYIAMLRNLERTLPQLEADAAADDPEIAVHIAFDDLLAWLSRQAEEGEAVAVSLLAVIAGAPEEIKNKLLEALDVFIADARKNALARKAGVRSSARGPASFAATPGPSTPGGADV